MQDDLPAVDLITVTYNSLDFLPDYCRSLQELAYPADKVRVFFVDNCSSDGSVDFIQGWHPGFSVSVIKNAANLGYAKAVTMALARTQADYIGLLNSDTRPGREWLSQLVRAMTGSSDIGMCVSQRIPVQAYGYTDPVTHETSWCSGGQSLVRRAALEKTGSFDERFFMYGEDLDLSWRMWLSGFRCLYVAGSVCEHHFGRQERYRSRRYYYQARNTVLLCYAYGSSGAVRRQIERWARESLSLVLKKGNINLGWAIARGLAAHLCHIPYFLQKRRLLRRQPLFEQVREKWIRL